MGQGIMLNTVRQFHFCNWVGVVSDGECRAVSGTGTSASVPSRRGQRLSTHWGWTRSLERASQVDCCHQLLIVVIILIIAVYHLSCLNINYGFNAVYISVHLSVSLPFSVSAFLRINVFINIDVLAGHQTCDSQFMGSSPGWAPLCSCLVQATYTYVPLSPSSIIWYRPRGWCLWLGK